jgi:hypothetical protein
VTDRDRVFTSKLWQEIFKSLKVALHYSSAYHPQSNSQTERVNQCLENYLRCMVCLEPKKWLSWLSVAEWWYNTSYHSSLQSTPFEALYGYPPPLVNEIVVPGPDSPALDFIKQKQYMIRKLKENLAQAQARMKKFADLKRSERQFSVGDFVYLKLQPFKHTAFAIHQNLKLTTKFYGAFKILEKIGLVAYKLQLPDLAGIHLVFHVSQLKRHLGQKAVPQSNLPLITPEGYIKFGPIAVLDTRSLPRRDEVVTQWLIQWLNVLVDQAMWEDKLFIQATFPTFYFNTLKEWWPSGSSHGQEEFQGRGSCHDPAEASADGTPEEA